MNVAVFFKLHVCPGEKRRNDSVMITYERIYDFISHTGDEQKNSSLLHRIGEVKKFCEVGAKDGDIITFLAHNGILYTAFHNILDNNYLGDFTYPHIF